MSAMGAMGAMGATVPGCQGFGAKGAKGAKGVKCATRKSVLKRVREPQRAGVLEGEHAAIASASLVADWLEGASIVEAAEMAAERVVQRLELAPERHHVAALAVEAARRAVMSLE